ncbi:MAG: hypothetical protein H7066_11825 [Cytophagaceae bacterium]|nr:hypothetical protein [Gemmatimonadaceae bacterium]
MYSILLSTHNVVRWLVLAVGVFAVVRVWRGWMTRAAWTESETKVLKAYTGVASLQFVVGIVLYLMSPLVRQGWGDMGAAMRDANLRKFVVEHPLMMIVAVALVHIGAGRVRKVTSDSGRYQAATIFWGIAIAITLGFIPWARPFLPF